MRVCLVFLCVSLSVFAADKPTKAEKQAARQAAKAAAAPRAPIFNRLAEMSPEERAAALAKLPPAQRQRIEQRLENFARQSPEQQARALDQQRRLMALPPERRMQARQSLRELRDTQPPRRGVIRQELQKLGSMTDEQRTEYMNSRPFRERFSESEIRMMSDLRGIVP